jgi:integrase
MSSIYEKRGWWYYQWREGGDTKVRALRTQNKTLAEQVQKQWDAKRELFAHGITPQKIDFQTAIEKFLLHKATQLKERSRLLYVSQLRTLHAGLGVKHVGEISSDKVSAFVAARQKAGVTNKTITDELILLRGLFKYLLKEGLIKEVPVRSWPTLKIFTKDPERIGFYTQEEIKQLKWYFHGHPFQGPFLFTLYTGVRRSEIRLARRRDINLDKNLVGCRSVKTEGHGEQIRYIPMHPELRKLLSAYAGKGKPDDFLFPELFDHSRNWPHECMKEACKKLEITYRRFHGLRHTVATFLLDSGMSLRDLMEIMGWTTLETAQKYIHFARAAGKKMTLPY